MRMNKAEMVDRAAQLRDESLSHISARHDEFMAAIFAGSIMKFDKDTCNDDELIDMGNAIADNYNAANRGGDTKGALELLEKEYCKKRSYDEWMENGSDNYVEFTRKLKS